MLFACPMETLSAPDLRLCDIEMLVASPTTSSKLLGRQGTFRGMEEIQEVRVILLCLRRGTSVLRERKDGRKT